MFDGKTDDKTKLVGGSTGPVHHLTMVGDGCYMGFVETETKEGTAPTFLTESPTLYYIL